MIENLHHAFTFLIYQTNRKAYFLPSSLLKEFFENYFIFLFCCVSAKATCSQKIRSSPSKRETTGLIFGGSVVRGRKYPWAGAFFHNELMKCGGNLGKFNFNAFNQSKTIRQFEIFYKKFFLFSNSKTRFVCGPLSTRKKTSKY